jgi:D-isomer specific 2-hydroxyacid dehydrogenase, NAD binding domain
MDVVAWSQNLTEERCAELGVTRVTKDELVSSADVLGVFLVFSERSRNTLRANDLAKMERGAILVNISRGPIVEEAALVEALRSGQLAGAGRDVFDREPLPVDHPFRSPEHGDDEANRSNRVDLLRSEDCPSARVHARRGRGDPSPFRAQGSRVDRPGAHRQAAGDTVTSVTPCAATTLFISPPCFRRAGPRTEPLPAGRAISVPLPQVRYKLVPR